MTTGDSAVIAPAGRAWYRALRLTHADVGAVARSLLGVLGDGGGRAGIGFSVGCGVGGGRRGDRRRDRDAGQPGGRVPVVIVVSLQMGAAVFLGALTASYNVVFIVVVAIWCFAAGMQWALGSKPGLVAAAAAALLVISPPVAPSLTAVVFSTLADRGGRLRSGGADRCVAAAALAGQRDALTQRLPGTRRGRPPCRRRP